MQSLHVTNKLTELYNRYSLKGIHLSFAEYSMFLQMVVGGFSKVYIVVDGLDECPHREIDDVRDKLLDQLKGLPHKVQLLVTSRDLPAIELKFAMDPRLEIHASKQAIEGYLEARINGSENLSRHIRKKPALRQNIVETVARKAEGM